MRARAAFAHFGGRRDFQFAHTYGIGRRPRQHQRLIQASQSCGALMRILDRSVYVGPSLYARFPVIRLELDLEALEAWPTGRLGGEYVDALSEALPGLAQQGCSYRD